MRTLLLLSLLSVLQYQVLFYVNVSLCAHQAQGFPQNLQAADAVVALHPLVGGEWSIFLSDNRIPQALQIVHPRAGSIAVNFKQLDLLSGDKVVVRDPNGSMSITVTPANASSLVEELKTSNNSPHSLLLQTHPFLVKGDSVVVEYLPSIPTLMLPVSRNQRSKPIVVMDSYASITYSSRFGASRDGVDLESTVGAKVEAKEAVCYRKTQPKMYAKARAVARLMIRTDQDTSDGESEQATSWSFCTGWLIGAGNHLITNHHCMKDAAVGERATDVTRYAKEQEAVDPELQLNPFRWKWPRRSSRNKTGRVVEAIVGFMAETKTCQERGFMGERVGIVEARRVAVVAENPDLDYVLLRALTNGSTTSLTRRYGSLRLRSTGPVNGETIYIPQHPRGEPKEIAATKNGEPAIIEVAKPPSIDSRYRRPYSKTSDIQPIVWYNADTEPGSSGSPVLSHEDNTVVALHRAGNSENSQSASTELFNIGVRIDLIAQDLQRRNVLPKNALAS
ncbi:hypothetical protein PHMEG_00024253 [Phytophthora megakarya]|uniref:Serine protease n=1 Tax=Phytophthora megakarya TaxID=4795 RepID=A0A225VEX2_9STRA|nr:hypothetical protein PHMEG_00024253 [Phytophthora megakarya]